MWSEVEGAYTGTFQWEGLFHSRIYVPNVDLAMGGPTEQGMATVNETYWDWEASTNVLPEGEHWFNFARHIHRKQLKTGEHVRDGHETAVAGKSGIGTRSTFIM